MKHGRGAWCQFTSPALGLEPEEHPQRADTGSAKMRGHPPEEPRISSGGSDSSSRGPNPSSGRSPVVLPRTTHILRRISLILWRMNSVLPKTKLILPRTTHILRRMEVHRAEEGQDPREDLRHPPEDQKALPRTKFILRRMPWDPPEDEFRLPEDRKDPPEDLPRPGRTCFIFRRTKFVLWRMDFILRRMRELLRFSLLSATKHGRFWEAGLGSRLGARGAHGTVLKRGRRRVGGRSSASPGERHEPSAPAVPLWSPRCR